MRTLTRAAIALAAGSLAATLVAAPSSAADATTLNPGKLPRGADVAIPHLEGKTVVDGSIRVKVKAPMVRLLGTSGTAYVVGTANREGGHGRLLRVAADGTRTKLGRASVWTSQLSDDGQTVVSTRITAVDPSVVTVRSATTGEVLAKREFRGFVAALDAEAGRVLLGNLTKTWLWTTSTDSLAVVSRNGGYEGDISSDVVAGYTKDPYNGGCTVISRITTGERLWRNCRERVTSFNADASRMATIDLLSDGIGPNLVTVRSGSGMRLATFDVKGWFGEIGFESPTSLLLETNGRRKAATVRCTDAGCERASDLSRTVQPRVA
jgi:hypothetical protein